MNAIAVTLEDQRRAFEIKYLLEATSTENNEELLATLNKIYPFTQYPLKTVPPIELFDYSEETRVSSNIKEELDKNCYIILVGALVVCRGSHEYIEGRLLTSESQNQINFHIGDEGVFLKTLPNTCFLKIHNIWIEMAKKRFHNEKRDEIRHKMLHVPFFASLTFEEYNKCANSAEMIILGPGKVLLKAGQTPYGLYILVEGELFLEKKVSFVKNKELENVMLRELQRENIGSCREIFEELVRNPKEGEETFDTIFRVKSVEENEIICAKETLLEESLAFDIVSNLKTKLICLKYPHFYYMSSDKLSEIREWNDFTVNEEELRKDYYYQMKWKEFKEKVKNETRNAKSEGFQLDDKAKNGKKHTNLSDLPASNISKLREMAYTKEFQK